MQISQRAQAIPASPIRKLIPYADDAKKRGIKVYHLNIGQPDIKTPQQMWERIKNSESEVLAYGPSNGLLSLRSSLVNYYNKYQVNITSKQICVTTGGSEAILFALMVTTNPNDDILIPEPYYANYNGFANLAQVNVVPVPTTAENGFRLPARTDIEANLTPKTKAILFANPGNPTGVVYTHAELQMLADIARKHQLFIIADEVYREFVYEGSFKSLLSLPNIDEYAIITDSISKRYSACGARIGCLVSKNANIMTGVMKYAQARLCPPTLEQIGAIGALTVSDHYIESIRAEYRRRRDLVMNKIQRIKGVICHTPRGAFYCIVKLPIDDSEKFAKWMLTDFTYNNQTTIVAPATGFYKTAGMGKDEVRLSYVLNTNELSKAIDVLLEGVMAYRETFHL